MTVTITDTADAVFSLFKTKAIGANATVELLTAKICINGLINTYDDLYFHSYIGKAPKNLTVKYIAYRLNKAWH